MKKIISTLFLGLACTIGVQAQEYNLFYDVDADGWLWFDSQEKIDKYVGLCNEADNKIDPNGKIIQMVPADIAPDYPPTYAAPFWEGAGEGGEIGAEGFRTGAIITAASSAIGNPNGGGFVVLMPSCSSFSICLSPYLPITTLSVPNMHYPDLAHYFVLEYSHGKTLRL